MIKRILVALSGTPFTPAAIAYGVELAQIHSAEITGVTLVDTDKLADVGPIPVGGGPAAHQLREQRMAATKQNVDAAISEFKTACSQHGITFHICREKGNPFDRLLALWRYHDMTVFGMRGLFDYNVVHHPDDELIKLLAKGVRPIITVAENHRAVRKVMIGYNGSMESAKAMKRFMQSRLWPNISIKIVCLGNEDDIPDLLNEAQGYCRAHGVDAETEHHTHTGPDQLLSLAQEQGMDLLVMGSTARWRIFKHILGDTVLHAIRNAEIPLFLAQ